MSVDLKSSAQTMVGSEYITQVIHFVGGEKRTFHNIDTKSIKQGQFTKLKTKDGRVLMVNDKNVLLIEIFKEN